MRDNQDIQPNTTDDPLADGIPETAAGYDQASGSSPAVRSHDAQSATIGRDVIDTTTESVTHGADVIDHHPGTVTQGTDVIDRGRVTETHGVDVIDHGDHAG